VSIDKVDVNNGSAHTVKYYVKGGSPKLQALVRRVEWTENELSVVEQMQMLKLDTVVSERRLAAARTSQLTNPYFPPGFLPPLALDSGCYGTSPLQKALSSQLAFEATPQAALQLIDFLEKQQTELDKELKALPPQEKKEAQGPVDDLRPRLAALARNNVGSAQSQPVASLPSYQVSTPAPAPAVARSGIEVQWGGSWFPAEVLQTNGALTQIHYTGWGSSSDEWVPAGRIRQAETVSAPLQPLNPLDPVAFRNPANVLQMGQQIQQQFQLVSAALQK
jgi:hypothetical protein